MLLIGLVLVALGAVGLVAGMHVGPHAHTAGAAAAGVGAAVLIAAAVNGTSPAPLVVGAGVAGAVIALGAGALGIQGLRRPVTASSGVPHLEGSHGVALSELAPDGTVRVMGEDWSATCANGRVPAGGRVQVIGVDGVRVTVWGEDIASDGAMNTGRGDAR